MSVVRRFLCALLMLGTGWAVAAPPSAPSAKPVRIIVPFSAGGGTDTFAHLVAAHLGAHLPGKPQVIVENIAGQGGVTGSNAFVDGSSADGITLLAVSGHLNLRALLGLRGLKLDFSRMEPLLAAPMGHVTVVPANAGITSAHQIRRLKGQLAKGINDPVGQIESLVTLEMFDLDYRPVPGFGGRGDTLDAFKRGELSINTQSTPVYLSRLEPLVRLRRVMPLYAIGFIDENGRSLPDPAVPGMVTAPDLYQRVYGKPPSGKPWEAFKLVVPLVQEARASLWMKGDLPAATRESLRVAMAEMVRDASFHVAAREALGGYPVLQGHELRRIRASMSSTPPEVLDYLRNMLKTRYGVEFER